MSDQAEVNDYMKRQDYLDRLNDEYQGLANKPDDLTPDEVADIEWYKQETLKTRAAMHDPATTDQAADTTEAQIKRQVAQEFGFDNPYQQGLQDYAEITQDPPPTGKS